MLRDGLSISGLSGYTEIRQLTQLSISKQGINMCLCQRVSCWVFAKDVQCVHFSFSSHLPRNLKESFFHGTSVPSACLTFQTWAWLKILSISRRLLLKSVMLHLRPYNCFSVVCLLLFVPVRGTCVRVTVVMTLTFFSFFNCTVCQFWWTLDSFRCSFKKKKIWLLPCIEWLRLQSFPS